MPKVERLLKFKDTPDGSITRSSSRGGDAGGTDITGWKEYATLVVAANDSTPHGKLYADYVCDGMADQAEINTALSVATASGFRRVLLLEGTFHISGAILIDGDETTLEGQGAGTIIRLVDNHDALIYMIDAGNTNDADRLQLKNFVIDGNRANQGTGVMYGVLGFSTESMFQNLWIRNMRTYGIYLNGGTNDISSCQFTYNGSYCIYLQTNAHSTVHGNIIRTTSGTGIYLTASHYTSLANNVLDQCVGLGVGNAMEIWDSNKVQVTGNWIGDVLNAGAGVFVYGVDDSQIVGNYIHGLEFGIRLDGACENCQVVANKIHDINVEAGSYAISVDSAIGTIISNNDLRNCMNTIDDSGGTNSQILDTFSDQDILRLWVTSGDPTFVWTIAAIDEWYAGVDDGDADKWKLGTGAAVGTNVAITVDSALDVGVGIEAPAGQLHIDQASTSGAQPVLYLDQGDVDEEFIRFDGTSAADQTKSISTVNGDGVVTGPKDFAASAGWAYEGMVRVNINGTDRWMPYYSADTS